MRVLGVMLVAMMLVLGGCVPPALAALYVSANGGAGWTNSSDLSVQGHNSSGEHDYDIGYVMSLAVGNTYANGVRAELEIPYRFNDIDEFTMEGPSNPNEFDREISCLAAMANVYYDFATGSAFTPFVGAGLGYALMQVEGWHDHHDADVFAYQLMAGCGYAFSEKVTIDLQYRMFATQDPEFETRDPEFGHIRIDSEYMTNNLMLGLRYNF